MDPSDLAEDLRDLADAVCELEAVQGGEQVLKEAWNKFRGIVHRNTVQLRINTLTVEDIVKRIVEDIHSKFGDDMVGAYKWLSEEGPYSVTWDVILSAARSVNYGYPCCFNECCWYSRNRDRHNECDESTVLPHLVVGSTTYKSKTLCDLCYHLDENTDYSEAYRNIAVCNVPGLLAEAFGLGDYEEKTDFELMYDKLKSEGVARKHPLDHSDEEGPHRKRLKGL